MPVVLGGIVTGSTATIFMNDSLSGTEVTWVSNSDHPTVQHRADAPAGVVNLQVQRRRVRLVSALPLVIEVTQ